VHALLLIAPAVAAIVVGVILVAMIGLWRRKNSASSGLTGQLSDGVARDFGLGTSLASSDSGTHWREFLSRLNFAAFRFFLSAYVCR
jgi:hypothetical protein